MIFGSASTVVFLASVSCINILMCIESDETALFTIFSTGTLFPSASVESQFQSKYWYPYSSTSLVSSVIIPDVYFALTVLLDPPGKRIRRDFSPVMLSTRSDIF